jgi:hypothetical protein
VGVEAVRGDGVRSIRAAGTLDLPFCYCLLYSGTTSATHSHTTHDTGPA